jgi:hypothetical protein
VRPGNLPGPFDWIEEKEEGGAGREKREKYVGKMPEEGR